MKRFVWIASTALLVGVAPLSAQDSTPPFTFGTFTISGAVILSPESIGNAGTVSGFYMDASGNYKGFLRSSSKVVTTFTDPGDTQPLTFTQGYQINDQGVVVGQFYNSSENTYSGFFYSTGTKTFTTYDVPGQPAGTITAVLGINTTGSSFCGYVTPPPYTTVSAFVNVSGQVTVYAVSGSTHTECMGMNDSDSVGYYNDSLGASHGYKRNSKGTITFVNYPGASTAAASLPCGGTGGGTVLAGISDRGDISGFYWDASNNEHGLSLSGGGSLQSFDYPGAFQTAAGGTNIYGTIAGYYLNSACTPTGFLAYRPAGGH